MNEVTLIDNIKKYKKYLVEQDPDLKISLDMLGISGLNNFIAYNSSPRGVMMASHISQSLVLNNPEPKIVYTGLEDELGKYSMLKKFDHDVEVIAVIPRYGLGTGVNPIVEYVIIYRDTETDVIDAMSIPRFNRFHTYFGFKYIIDEEYINSLMTGDIIPAGKVLAWSPGYNPETEEYSYGVNLNVIFMSLEGIAEDGVIVSESALKKLEFTLIDHRAIEGGSKTSFLNIYGDDEEFKPFPDIDEPINDTSIFAVTRENDVRFAPMLYTRDNLKSYNVIFDKCVYARKPGGNVEDIKVYKNNLNAKLPEGTEKQLEKYSNALITFYKKIIEVYESRNKAYKTLNKEDLVVGDEFGTLLNMAYTMVETSAPKSRVKKTLKKDLLDLYRVEADISYVMRPGIKYKISSIYGDKGVIVRVWKDEWMPVDEHGNRADIIMDPAATVSRLNIGRLYDRYLAASSRIVRDKIRNLIHGKDIDKLSDNEIKHIFKDYVLEFLSLIKNPQYYLYKEHYENNDIETMKEILKVITAREFYIMFNAENELPAWEVIANIENSEFKPIPTRVRYVENGREIVTETKFMIAPMYIILHHKIGDATATCASAKLNHFGVPISPNKNEKTRLPYYNAPVRTIGETEGRLYAAYGGRKFIAELVDRASSIETHGELYKNLLTHPQPTNIPYAVDRTKIPYGKNKTLELYKTFIRTAGIDLVFSEDLRRFIDPQDVVEQNIDINNVNVVNDDE